VLTVSMTDISKLCADVRRLLSPEPQRPRSLILENLPQLLGRASPGTATALAHAPSPPSPAFNLIPELEEIRVSPCIARKGYLNVLEEKSKTWKRRCVII
jgi:kinesin family protein 1